MLPRNVLFWAIGTALGGGLLGFDTTVVSGADKVILQLWSLSAFEHDFAISIVLIGTVLGAVFGGTPSEKLGGNFFGAMMVLQPVFVWRFMPEPKGARRGSADRVLVMH